MARYRKIDPRVWADERFRRLSTEQKLVAFYILTAQTNRIGLFIFSPAKASEDLEWPLRTFETRFYAVLKRLRWSWDKRSRVLYLPTWWKYNPPENANNLIGNLKDLAEIPANSFLESFVSNRQYLDRTLHETFTRTLLERYPQRFGKRSATQEQQQERKQEQEQEVVGRNGKPSRPAPAKLSKLLSDEDIEELKRDPAYKGIDVERELAKMDRWLRRPENQNKIRTVKRFENWLNKAEPTLPVAEGRPKTVDWRNIDLEKTS